MSGPPERTQDCTGLHVAGTEPAHGEGQEGDPERHASPAERGDEPGPATDVGGEAERRRSPAESSRRPETVEKKSQHGARIGEAVVDLTLANVGDGRDPHQPQQDRVEGRQR